MAQKAIKMNNELSIQRDQSTEKILEEIVYIISHDLQVPLISIEGYASELLEVYKDRLDQDGLYCLQRLKANAQRMYRLVLSLLEISRLNTHKYPYETFDPVEMVNRTAQELILKSATTGIRVEVEAKGITPIRGDKQRLGSVFAKLLSNAINYGGKEIKVGCRNNTWFVKDDGIGIPPDQLENIFKGGNRLKRVEVEGVGLGLTFCKYVVCQHGGRIWAESTGDNKGSTFFFTLKDSS
jgi:signal transduction histidine kinase